MYRIAFVYEFTPAGNFLVGSSREFIGMSADSDPEIVRLVARRALRFLPGIAGVNVIRTYTGFRPWTADGRAIISGVQEVPGLYVAAGRHLPGGSDGAPGDGPGHGKGPRRGPLSVVFGSIQPWKVLKT